MPVIDQYGTFSRSSSAFASNVGHGERNVRDGRVSSQWQSGLSRNGRNGRQLPGSVGLKRSGTAAFLLTSAIARRGRSDCFAPKTAIRRVGHDYFEPMAQSHPALIETQDGAALTITA